MINVIVWNLKNCWVLLKTTCDFVPLVRQHVPVYITYGNSACLSQLSPVLDIELNTHAIS